MPSWVAAVKQTIFMLTIKSIEVTSEFLIHSVHVLDYVEATWPWVGKSLKLSDGRISFPF
ncbi:hypothetical protein GCM10011297_00790 [Bacterioplanes sanyensis]|nr:hypothetical protein GCM10011297_00790 [Bacterioplanes sanyensis]